MTTPAERALAPQAFVLGATGVSNVLVLDTVEPTARVVMLANASSESRLNAPLSGAVVLDNQSASFNVRFGADSNARAALRLAETPASLPGADPDVTLSVPGTVAATTGVRTAAVYSDTAFGAIPGYAAEPTGAVSFKRPDGFYSSIVEVENLVVNNAITSRLGNFQNLPSNVARLDDETNRLPDALLGSNVVLLNADKRIDGTLLPPVDTGRSTLLHTTDRVGIGLRFPKQKLHVLGNTAIDTGRLGVGPSDSAAVTAPLARLHVVDDNAATAALIVQTGTRDALDVRGNGQRLLLATVGGVTATPVVVVGGGAAYGSAALTVGGMMHADRVDAAQLTAPNGRLDLAGNSLSNVRQLFVTDLYYNNLVNTGANNQSGTFDTVFAGTLSARSGGDNGILINAPVQIQYITGGASKTASLAADALAADRLNANLEVAAPTVRTAALRASAGTGNAISLGGTDALCNAAVLDADVLSVRAVTHRAGQGAINFGNATLASVGRLEATAVAATTYRAPAGSTALDFGAQTLSNFDAALATASLRAPLVAACNVLATTFTAPSGRLDFAGQTLSNAAQVTAGTVTASASVAAPNATFLTLLACNVAPALGATALNFGATTLSNVGNLLAANATVASLAATTAAVGTLSPALGATSVLLGGAGVSNVGTLSAQVVAFGSLAPLISGSEVLNAGGYALSNVRLVTSSLASDRADRLLMCDATLCNLNALTATISGFATDATAGSSANAIVGAPVDSSRVGLRVAHNVLAGAYLSTSDARAKTEVEAVSNASCLEAALQLPVVQFRWRHTGERQIGFLAQDVERVSKQAVRVSRGVLPTLGRDAWAQGGAVSPVAEGGGAGLGLKVGEVVQWRHLGRNGDPVVSEVVAVSEDGAAAMLSPAPPDGAVHLVGHVVPDARMLEPDRLLPLAFGALQALAERVVALEAQLSRFSDAC